MSTVDISTDRLVLRRFRDDDAPRLNALVQDPRIYRGVGRIPPHAPMSLTEDFLDRSRAAWSSGAGYGFAVTQAGQLIGVVGGGADPGFPHDVGYWIAPDSWGRGYASEAFAAYLAWLETDGGQRCVTAGYFPDNPASGRVLRKSGFLPCGRSRYFCLGRQEIVGCIDMVRVA